MSSKGIVGKLTEGLTLRVFVLGLAINLLFLVMLGFNNGIGWGGTEGARAWGWDGQSDFVAVTFKWDFRPFPWSMIWVTMLIALATYKFAKAGRPFTAAELSILFAWTAGGMAWTQGSMLNQYLWGVAGSPLQESTGGLPFMAARFVPPFVTPTVDVWEQGYYQGAVPWGAWLPVIAFWTVFGGSMMIFTFAITLIMRKRWIEIERMPYPYAAIPLEAMKLQDAYLVESSEARKGRRYTHILWIGFIMGFLWGLPGLIPPLRTSLRTSVPQYVWPGLVEWDLYALQPNLPPIFYLGSNSGVPLFFLWFIVPLDVLISMAATSVFWLDIVLPILKVGGILPYGATPAAANNSWWIAEEMWTGYRGVSLPFNPGYAFGDVVGFMALGGWSLWFARGYIRNTFKAFLKPGSVAQLEEENEPLSYRYSWLLAIISGLILFVMMLVIRMPIHGALIMFICTFLSIHGWNRLRGEAGFVGRAHWETAALVVPYRYVGFDGWYQGIESVGEVTQQYWSTFTYSTFMYGIGGVTTVQVPISNFGDSWKVAHETKSTKGAFKAMVIGMVLSLLLFLPITIAVMYWKGINNTAVVNTIWGPTAGLQGIVYNPSAAAQLPTGNFPWINVPYAYTHLIIGVVVIGAMMMARMRFVWFPISPVGFVLGSGFWASNYFAHGGIIGLATIAAVVKYLIIRFGGARIYEEYAGPLAIGVISGWMVTLLLSFIQSTYLSLIVG